LVTDEILPGGLSDSAFVLANFLVSRSNYDTTVRTLDGLLRAAYGVEANVAQKMTREALQELGAAATFAGIFIEGEDERGATCGYYVDIPDVTLTTTPVLRLVPDLGPEETPVQPIGVKDELPVESQYTPVALEDPAQPLPFTNVPEIVPTVAKGTPDEHFMAFGSLGEAPPMLGASAERVLECFAESSDGIVRKDKLVALFTVYGSVSEAAATRKLERILNALASHPDYNGRVEVSKSGKSYRLNLGD
jgi:hypothetical protein